MPAVTSTILALGGLGLSAAQHFNQVKNKQESEKAATIAQNRLNEIEASNKLAVLKAPDISKIAFERNARAEADALAAVSEMGPEAAAQATRISEATRESNLAAAERQGEINYKRDLAVASQEQENENNRVDREASIAWGELQGAQAANADAQAAGLESAMGVVGAAGNVISGLGSATSLEAKANRTQNKNNKKSKQQNGLPPANSSINDPMQEWSDHMDAGSVDYTNIG